MLCFEKGTVLEKYSANKNKTFMNKIRFAYLPQITAKDLLRARSILRILVFYRRPKVPFLVFCILKPANEKVQLRLARFIIFVSFTHGTHCGL